MWPGTSTQNTKEKIERDGNHERKRQDIWRTDMVDLMCKLIGVHGGEKGTGGGESTCKERREERPESID